MIPLEFNHVDFNALKETYTDLAQTFPEMPTSALGREATTLYEASVSSHEVRAGLLTEIQRGGRAAGAGYQEFLTLDNEVHVEDLALLAQRFSQALKAPVTLTVNSLPLRGSPDLSPNDAVREYFESTGRITDNVGDIRYELNDGELWTPRKVAICQALANCRDEVVHATVPYNYKTFELDFSPGEAVESGISRLGRAYNDSIQ
jgi:hypothetical protein